MPSTATATSAEFQVNLGDYALPSGGVNFANPNAPTGSAIGVDRIERFLKRHTESVVVIDEAYVDFGAESAIRLIESYPQLLVVQTLSKSRSLAGMPIGFAFGHRELIEALERVKNGFNSQASLAYVVNELDSTVTAYRFDTSSGALEPFQLLSTLPDRCCGDSRASEIEIDRSGRTPYVSNRGLDSIAVFSIDARTGRLELRQVAPSQGRTPRYFAISPNGQTLFALNEESDAISPFAIDPHTGTLTPAGEPLASGSPVCMVFSSR